MNAPHLYGKLVIENSSTEKETRSTRNEEEEETKCNQFDDYYVAHTQLHKRKWQIFVSSFDFLVIFLSALAFLAIFLFSNSIQNRLQLFLFSFIFVFFFHLNKKKNCFRFTLQLHWHDNGSFHCCFCLPLFILVHCFILFFWIFCVFFCWEISLVMMFIPVYNYLLLFSIHSLSWTRKKILIKQRSCWRMCNCDNFRKKKQQNSTAKETVEIIYFVAQKERKEK